jgi:hypothetical protein
MADSSSFIPARLLLEDVGVWPADIAELEGGESVLDRVGVRDVAITEAPHQVTANFTLVFAGELRLSLTLVSGASLVFGDGTNSTTIQVQADLIEPQAIRFVNVSSRLRFSPGILKPVKLVNGRFEGDPSQKHVEIGLNGTIVVAGQGLRIEGSNAVRLNPAMIGDSGVVIESSSVLFHMSPDSPLPQAVAAGLPANWTGIFIGDAELHLPPELISAVPPGLKFRNCFIGAGGFSGESSFEATPLFQGKLFDFEFNLQRISLAFRQNTLARSEIGGIIKLPFFDQNVALDLNLSGNGQVSAGLSLAQPSGVTQANGIARFEKAGLFVAEVQGLSFKGKAEDFEVHLAGKIKPLVAGLDWPDFDVKSLSINSTGKVKVDGGWLDLPKAKTFNFHGFKLELSKIGFGKEESGEQWIGLNGAVHLAPGMPMGASVEGLRIIWDPKKFPQEQPRVELRGVGVNLDVPGAFAFKGKVAFFENKERGSRGFRGDIKLTLHALNCTVDGKLTIGQSLGGYTFFYIYLAASLPAGIPLFNTGAAIYGFQGLVAVNMEPNRKSEETWYEGWYKRDPIGATETTKWDDIPGSLALGLGVSIGTAPDDGFSVNTKTLLVLVMPGPVILLEGKGDFLKVRPGTEKTAAEGAFTALLALDMRQRIFQMNLEANYSLIKVLDIHGAAEAFFNFDDPAAWHLYLGQKEPETKRIGGSYLNLFRANAYFMRTSDSLALGGFVGYKTDPPWAFGPLTARFEAWMAGDGTVSLNPGHLEGKLQLYGLLGLRAFGAGLDLNVDAQAIGRGPTPWVVDAWIRGAIKINLLVKTVELKAEIPLHWEELAEPLPPEPLLGMAAEHFKTDEAWEMEMRQPVPGDTNIPMPSSSPVFIPPDAKPIVTFTRPLSDDIRIGQAILPDPPAEVVTPGEYEFRYRLRHVELLQNEGTWEGVSSAAYIEEVSLPDKIKLSGFLSNGGGFKGGLLTTPTASYEIDDVDTSGALLTIRGGSAALQPGPCLLSRSTRSANGAITAVADQDDGTSKVTLNIPSGQHLLPGTYAGGLLKVGVREFPVLGNSTDVVDVLNIREASGLVIRPVAGEAFSLAAPSAGILFGKWLPTDQVRPEAKTKLQLWSQTPYTYFRRNDSSVLPRPFDVCGPNVREEPICVGLERLQDEGGREVPLGPLLPNKRYQAGLLAFVPDFSPPVNSIQYGEFRGRRVLQFLGARGGPRRVEFAFNPPLDVVEVYGSGDLKMLVNGTDSTSQSLGQGGLSSVRFDMSVVQDSIRSLTVMVEREGTGSLEQLCVTPGWTCAAIPAGAVRPNVDRVEVGGIIFSGKNEAAEALQIISERASALAAGVASYPPSSPLGRFRSPALELANLAGSTLRGLPGTESALVRIRSLLQIVSNLFQQLPQNPPTLRQTVEGVVTSIASLGLALSRTGSLRIQFPTPVTRVRLSMRGRTGTPLTVKAFGDVQEFQSLGGIAQRTGQLLLLDVTKHEEGWIDRIEVVGLDPVLIEVCYDRPEFAWSRKAQYTNRQVWRRQLESWYSHDPVFKPETNYCLKLVTEVSNSAKPELPPQIKYWYGFFQTGTPPMGQLPGRTAYPGGGLLADLSSYVFRSVPDNGAGQEGKRPHYRRYDIGVEFNENYVDRLYLQSLRGLGMRLLDNNGRTLAEIGNDWGTVPHRQVSTIKAAWVGNLNLASSMRCATVNWQKVPADKMLLAGGEDMLLESQTLHRAEVVAKSGGERAQVYAFEFTTSKFANFLHHIHSFEERVWHKDVTIDPAATLDQIVADALNDVQPKVQAVEAARPDLLTKAKEAGIVEASDSNAHPTREDFAAYEDGVKAINQIWQEVEDSAARWHTQISRIIGLEGLTTPQSLELNLIKTTTGSKWLFLHSPEPVDWRRTKITLSRLTTSPLSSTSHSFLLGSGVKITTVLYLTASDYYVELFGRKAASLEGYRLEVAPDAAQLSFVPYFTFSKEHGISLGKRLRVHAPSHANREPSVQYISQELDRLISGEQIALPSGVVWIRLVAPTDQVVHQQVVHPSSHYQTVVALALYQASGPNALVLPSKDGSRAFVLLKDSEGINVQSGSYLLRFDFLRDIGPEAPVLREAGRTTEEIAILQFITG